MAPLVREISHNSGLGINTDLPGIMYIIEDFLPLATTKDSKILKHSIHHQTYLTWFIRNFSVVQGDLVS